MNSLGFFALTRKAKNFLYRFFFITFLFLSLFCSSYSIAMNKEDDVKTSLIKQQKSYKNYKSMEISASINDEEEVLVDDIQSFLKWINKDVLVDVPSSNKFRIEEFLGVLGLSNKQRVAKYLGVGVGITGCLVFYNLGRGLALEIVDNEAFGVITGVASAVPIAILGSQFCSYIFTQFVTSSSKEELEITKKKGYPTIVARRTAQVFESALAVVSAAPITYLTNKYYYPMIGYSAIVLDVPAFIAKVVSDYWAMDTTSSMFVNLGKNAYLNRKYKDQVDSIQYKRFKLIEHLNQAFNAANSMSDQEANDIYNSLVEYNFEQQDDVQIKMIFNPPHSRELQEPPKKYNWGHVIAGTVGCVVGAFSSVCLIPLAEESMANFLPVIGIHSAIADKVCGWIAGVAAGSLMTYASKESFEKFYDFFAALPKYCRKKDVVPSPKIQRRDVARVAIAGGSLILSAYSSAPQAYLSEEYIGSSTPLEIFTLTCAALGPFAMDFWAIDNYFKRFLDKNGPKEKMFAAIQKIQHKIPTLDDNIVEKLYDKVKDLQLKEDIK